MWVWTELTESIHPDRKAGNPIWEHLQINPYTSWKQKGYIRYVEAEGQLEIKF